MGHDGWWDDTTPSWALSLHLMAASEITPNDMVKLPRSLNVTCEKWTERGVGWVDGELWEDCVELACGGSERNGAMVGGVSTVLTSLVTFFFVLVLEPVPRAVDSRCCPL